MKRFLLAVAVATSALFSGVASAGPFILAGTDADDHGFANAFGNQDGWFFMQRALENLAAGVTTGNKKVTILGSTGSSLAAASSAFNLSSLVGLGWTLQTVSTTNFGTFFVAGGNLGTGILMMDSGGNVGGGVDGSAFVTHASAINTFLGAGGSLFSQANGYDWLSALIPGLRDENESRQGLALTAAGNAAFPGLNNGDLSSGPYHNRFENIGTLSVFATSTITSNNIIIGSAGGSITNPNPGRVPEPASLVLTGLALAALRMTSKRKTD